MKGNQRRKIRRHFGLSGPDIARDARRQRISLRQHYRNLQEQMKEQRSEAWVQATFLRWHEIEEGRHHPHQVTREIDGVLYVRLRDTINVTIPQRLARSYESHEIDDVKGEFVKYPSCLELLDCLSSGDSKSMYLELVSSKSTQRPKGFVEDPKKAKNRNGLRHMVSMCMTVNKKKKYLTRVPVHQDFRPGSFKAQYINPEFNRSGCCMWNCILNEFKESYDKKNKKKPLTYELIADIIKKEPGEACWDDFIPMFQKLGTKIVMLNNQKEVEARFVPEKQNTHLRRTLVMVRHDGHTYSVEDSDVKNSIAKTMEREAPDLDYVSDKYPEVMKYQLNGVVGSLDELRMKALECPAETQVYVWSGSSLLDTFRDLWFNEGVQATPTFCLGNITRMEIPFGDKTLVLRMPSQKPDIIPEMEKEKPEILERFEDLYHKTRESLLNKTLQNGFISNYSDDLSDVFLDPILLGCPRTGLFKETELEEFIGLDMKSCYPSILCKIKNIGMFGTFDSWEVYDKHRLEDTTLYQFSNGMCRFGVGYNKHCGEPVSFIRPHRRKHNTLGGAMKRVLTDDVIPGDLKKKICNMAIGDFGKRYRSKNKFEIFEDYNEALRFAQKYNMYDEDYVPPHVLYQMPGEERLWVVHIANRSRMSQGFQVIQKMIYDVCNKHIENLIDDLASKGITALGYKTDAVFVSTQDAEKLDYPWSYADSWMDIGKIKKEKKIKGSITVFKVLPPGGLIKVTPPIQPQEYTLHDEWNGLEEAFAVLRQTTQEDIDYDNPTITFDPSLSPDRDDDWEGHVGLRVEHNYKKTRPVAVSITADVAGSGKTYLATEYSKQSGKEFIVACFSNIQARKLKKEGTPATTLYKLCGKIPGEEEGSSESLPYEIVIIDELGMFGSIQRLMLQRLMAKNPTVQFIATEDLFQLPPIEFNWNPTNTNWYQKVSDTMFPVKIKLTIPKRFDDPEKAKQLKKDLWGNAFDINNYAKAITMEQAVNIYTGNSMFVSYTNETRHLVNSKIHGDQDYFIKGQTYISKCAFGAVVNACTYQLIDFDEEILELRDELDEKAFKVPRFTRAGVDRLSKEFLSLPYVMTCHSQQGSSIEGNVVIFEAELSYVSKNWLYVALTRARNLGKIYYVKGGGETDFDDVKYMRKKLQGYQTQDRQKGRKWENGQHIWIDDIKQMSKEQGHICCKCHGVMNLINNKSRDDWTVDRMDDSLPHVKGNCKLSHWGCNIAHKNME